MSDQEYQVPPESERIPAQELRRKIADKEIEEAKKAAEKARDQDEGKRKAYLEFMERQFTEADRVRIRRQIEKAAERGLFEFEILRFPAEYLEDHGRRINNGDPDWQLSLTGYGKRCCEAFKDLAQPQGYKLIARVLNYPRGMIGDIGLYVSWKG